MTVPPLSREAPVLAALLLLTAVVSVLTYYHLGEDAHISFRYSEMFAAGHGLVFNPGERVEGYSNLLWVLVMTPFALIGAPLHLAAKILSTGCLLGLIAGAWQAGRNLESDTPWWVRWFPAFAIAAHPLLHYHDDQGLETAAYAVMLGGALLALAMERLWLASTLAALAVITRPEGIGFALALAPAAAGTLDREGLRRAALYITPPLALFAAQLLFRLVYYGEWVPNTVIAKRSGGAGGLNEVVAYTLTRCGLPALALAGAALAALNSHRRTLAFGCLGLLLAAAAFQLRAGGLLNVGFRYLAPAYIPTVIGCWLLLAELHSRSQTAKAAPFAAAILFFLSPKVLNATGPMAFWFRGNTDAHRSTLVTRLTEPSTYDIPARVRWYLSEPIFINAEAGRWTAHNLPEDALLAADQMGMLGYYALDHEFIDLLGLMDAHIARHGVTLDYLQQRAPQYMVVEAMDTSTFWPAPWRGKPTVSSIRNVFETEDFAELYRPRWFLLTNLPFMKKGFLVYVHRDADDGVPLETEPIGVNPEEFEAAWRVL